MSGSTTDKAASARTTRPVVLVVDDDPDARDMYGVYLKAMGCRVYTAPFTEQRARRRMRRVSRQAVSAGAAMVGNPRDAEHVTHEASADPPSAPAAGGLRRPALQARRLDDYVIGACV